MTLRTFIIELGNRYGITSVATGLDELDVQNAYGPWLDMNVNGEPKDTGVDPPTAELTLAGGRKVSIHIHGYDPGAADAKGRSVGFEIMDTESP